MIQKLYNKMMMKINEIWSDLENDKSLTSGLLLRRYSATVLPDVYVAFQLPENKRCIAIRTRSENRINISHYDNMRDITLAIVPDEKDSTRSFLLIILANSDLKEVFATLCEDLINQIAHITEEDLLMRELLNRFEKWKSLFDRALLEGLSPEEQRGLYGELYFLRKWVSQSPDLQYCLQSWVGPEKEVRDFQSGGWAVEVKTTHGNNHQKIQISSERQLDTSNLISLCLYHISLDSQQLYGESLNQIVSSIMDLLSRDGLTQTQFRSKLMMGGYFFHHSARYDNTGYQIRNETFYNVRDQFPRIEERDIREGVGNVKYSIILSNYSDYAVSESFVFDSIK